MAIGSSARSVAGFLRQPHFLFSETGVYGFLHFTDEDLICRLQLLSCVKFRQGFVVFPSVTVGDRFLGEFFELSANFG